MLLLLQLMSYSLTAATESPWMSRTLDENPTTQDLADMQLTQNVEHSDTWANGKRS